VKQIKKYLFIVCGLLLVVYSHAQNLVPNPSFEDTVHCPTNTNELYDAQYWINPTTASPDYFNTCSTANEGVVHIPNNGYGSQSTHTGNAYAGFYAFNKAFPNMYREYIQANLESSLIANHKYVVSFYLNLADGSQYADDNVGAYFSSNQISSSNSNALTTYTPQIQTKPSQLLTDKVNWMLVSDTLTAQGGEQYITIGNFMKDSLSDTLFLGSSGGGNVAYYYIDDVSVIDINTMGIKQETNVKTQLSVYPNPNNGKICISGFDAKETSTSIEITDVTGKLVYKQQSSIGNGVVELNLQLISGVYFVHIINAQGATQIQKIVINN
jgi:hypothetical protein